MARFSDLPAEIVLGIWQLLHNPYAIESFALASRGSYALSGPYIQEHHRLRARFSLLESYPQQDEGSILAAYTRHFILNPAHALYVKEARFGHLRRRWSHGRQRCETALNVDRLPQWHQPDCKPDMQLFSQAIKDCVWIPRRERDSWVYSLKRGEEDPILALLITILFNIQKLTVETNDDPYTRRLEHFCQVAIPSCLGKLKEVDINQCDRDSYKASDPINVCGALPTITSLVCHRVRTSTEYNPRQKSKAMPLNPKMEHLTFRNCEISDKLLFDSLGRPSSLKTFAYDALEGYSKSINVFFVRTSLLTRARHSLESMSFSFRWDAIESYMGSIRELMVLKRVVTGCTTLLGRKGYADSYILPFADALPETIEEVKLNDCSRSLDVLPLIKDLIEVKKAGRFPHLHRFDLVIPKEENWHIRLPVLMKRAQAMQLAVSRASIQSRDVAEKIMYSFLRRLEDLALKTGLQLKNVTVEN